MSENLQLKHQICSPVTTTAGLSTVWLQLPYTGFQAIYWMKEESSPYHKSRLPERPISCAITGSPTVRMPVLMLVIAAIPVKMEMITTEREVDRSGKS